MHIKSITSKRCASITYCNTLLHPAFCPFCLGGNQPAVSASARWNSWTREAQLRGHLQQHLQTFRWPLQCPHPLCVLQLDDEKSFLYHLSDVHSLQISLHMNRLQQKEHDSGLLINWTPNTTSQKRKRAAVDEQERRPSKLQKDTVQIDRGNEQSPPQSLDRKAPHEIHTISPCLLPAVSFTNVASDSNPQDLPEMTNSGATSSPEVDELCFMNDMSPSEGFQERELHDHLGMRDWPGTTSNDYKSSLQDDALFSLYLRSRSPSRSSAKSVCHDNDDGSIHSHTITSGDICLSMEGDHHLACSIDQNTVKPKDVPIKAKKPHITLRTRQPEPRPKQKVLLRLSQPKQAISQRFVCQGKPGGNDRRRRRT